MFPATARRNSRAFWRQPIRVAHLLAVAVRRRKRPCRAVISTTSACSKHGDVHCRTCHRSGFDVRGLVVADRDSTATTTEELISSGQRRTLTSSLLTSRTDEHGVVVVSISRRRWLMSIACRLVALQTLWTPADGLGCPRKARRWRRDVLVSGGGRRRHEGRLPSSVANRSRS